MAIFSQQETPQKSAPEPPKRRGTQQPSLSVISSDLRIIGDLETDGVVKIEGQVEGTIRAGSQVLVSQGALIKGDIHTKEAVLGGEVTGVVQADERVEVQATALVNGDIVTRRIVVLEGGRVNGSVKMDGSGDDVGKRGTSSGSSVSYPSGSKPQDGAGN
jgi:cytoskeletal protein CcmA (bactofilin family)